jgi:hypothetical protein
VNRDDHLGRDLWRATVRVAAAGLIAALILVVIFAWAITRVGKG